MTLYWNLFFEKVSTEKLLEDNCLIKDWKKDLIEGPIIDIGCGQSKELLTFINSDRELFAVDKERLQLDFLKRRVIETDEKKINLWNFLKLNIGVDEIPSKQYSLIVCLNLLHF